MGSRKRRLQAHAHQRFGLRFGINLTPAVASEIVGMIQEGQSTFIEKQSNVRSLHRVTVQDQDIVVVYDKARAIVVTALYPDGLSLDREIR